MVRVKNFLSIFAKNGHSNLVLVLVLVLESKGPYLYTLQSELKGQLSTKVVEYFAKCFGYALVQNRNDAQGLKQSLRAIIPHAFGKHKYCSVTWCGFLKDPSSYCHASLPHGNNLKGDKMEEGLTNVIDMYIQNAEKLAPLGSSQSNEALNNTIGSKAPKIRHYGASETTILEWRALLARRILVIIMSQS